MTTVWWVNQRSNTVRDDYKIIWAPLYLVNKLGHETRKSHWSLLGEVMTGDIVLHHHQRKIVAISQVMAPAYESPRPWSDESALKWMEKGLRVPVDVAELDEPFLLSDLDATSLMQFSGPGSPFKTGTLSGQEGYFFRIPKQQSRAIFAALNLQVDLNPLGPETHVLINGASDQEGISKIRKEQPTLRRRLLAGRTKAPCDLCGREFPKKYLIASHIKRRSECSESERVDPHVAMLTCLFGCDAAFENGDLYVSAEGTLKVRPQSNSVLKSVLSSHTGRLLQVFGPQNSNYFEARRLQHDNTP